MLEPGASAPSTNRSAALAPSAGGRPVDAPFRPALRSLLTAALLVAALAACAPVVRPVARRAAPAPSPTAAPAPAPTPTAATPAPAPAAPAGWTQEGHASWYGPNFAGRPTANGEIFDPARLTAAHKELPFDTRVRVTNLANGRSVVVRINDRGPFKPNRVIDLSRGAAEAIGLVASGVAPVRLELAGGAGGMRPLRTDPRLSGYDVIVPGLPAGSLLVLEGAAGAEVLARTVALEPPAEPGVTGEDLWTSPVLAERLGTAATIVLD